MDLNADLGEGYAEDARLLSTITSANVACGFHAGDATTMTATVAGCLQAGVAVGAQVSYPDRDHFGRRPMDRSYDDLRADVTAQLDALAAVAAALGATVRFVKAHGALYHRIRTDVGQARAVVDALLAVDPALHLLTAPTGLARDYARSRGVRVVAEGFADRGYRPDGTLVPRDQPGAVHADPAAAAAQALRLAADGAPDGPVESLCVHSDTPGAAAVAAAVRAGLEAAGVPVRAWT